MNQPPNIPPPKWPLRFLRLMIKDEFIEEIEGDMEEVFLDHLDQYSSKKARRLYALDTLKLLRPIVLKNIFPQKFSINFAMFRHNLLITYRSFLRNKNSFLINLIGLSSGLACVLLIALWVNDELSIDTFHENDARLYQVLENVDQAESLITRQTTAGPTAKGLAEEFPEVEKAVTTTYTGSYLLTIDDKKFTADGTYASKDFFHLFSYDLIQGDKDQVLADKESIVISESLAKRLFGTADGVVGKMIEWEQDESYEVSGVFRDVPKNSSSQFEFLLTFEEFWDRNEWVRNWFNTMPRSYVLLEKGTDIEAFNAKIHDYVRVKTEERASHRSPFVAKYSERYLYNNYENGVQDGGRIEYVKLFSIVAGFILLIACINFMNLSTAKASRRMKEIGIKKTIGARRGSLIFQYLSESTLLSLASLVVALILVVLFLPQFNLITEKELTIDISPPIIGVLLGIVILTGLIAGSYPALYLSAIQPTIILKAKLNNLAGELWARKGLVVFQFAMSITLIVTVMVVYQQIQFAQNKNLGYEKDNVLIISRSGPLYESEKTESFLNEIRSLSGTLGAALGDHDMSGHNGGTYGVVWPGKDPEDRTEFERFAADYGTMELLGIEMKEGRTFSREFGADSSKIIFNEAGIKFMGLKDPIGKKITLWDTEMEIIGVTKDFHFESFYEEIEPLFAWLAPRRSGRIMVKIKAGEEAETIAQLEKLHQEFNPEFPMDYKFMDEDYQKIYTSEQRVSTLAKYFAGLAILISCLGLFGLAAFTAERRIKEISIRKILGSSIWGIVYLLSKDFTKLVMVSILIALPISYYIGHSWLEGFAYKIDLEWWFFAGAAGVSLLIAWITVGIQTIKVARINPSLSLKNE